MYNVLLVHTFIKFNQRILKITGKKDKKVVFIECHQICRIITHVGWQGSHVLHFLSSGHSVCFSLEPVFSEIMKIYRENNIFV